MNYNIDAAQIFTLFFIMLGPLKLLAPFARATRTLDEPHLRLLALNTIGIATAAMIAGAFFGRSLLFKWDVSVPVLWFVGGLVFFLVSMQGVMSQFAVEAPTPAAGPGADAPAPSRIAFPMVVTPYGMAALIVLLAVSHDTHRIFQVVVIAVAVMVLNLIAMIYVRPILKLIGPTVLQAAFAVLGVLTAALALQIVLQSLRAEGIISG
jgi:multiple antibiotic resistance protein